jgi:AcrR family transcriptional regulator
MNKQTKSETTTPARSTRGPQPTFSRDQIAAIAVQIADAEGIEAASIRRIASAIGSGATSLYRYIATKDEILDLMIDAALAESPSPKPSGDWRKDLRRIIERSHATILRHPWMIHISTFRLSRGTHTIRWLESTLVAIDGLGLDIDEMLIISNTLHAFARGYAAGEIAEQEAGRRSGLDRDQWMKSRAHETRALLATGNFPMFNRVVVDAKAPHDPRAAERGFTLGLDLLLDGIAVQIAARNRKPLKSSPTHPRKKIRPAPPKS